MPQKLMKLKKKNEIKYFKVLKENVNLEFPEKISFKNEGETKPIQTIKT